MKVCLKEVNKIFKSKRNKCMKYHPCGSEPNLTIQHYIILFSTVTLFATLKKRSLLKTKLHSK